MPKTIGLRWGVSSSVIVLSIMAGAAAAQEIAAQGGAAPAAFEIEKVVVTARKQAENLMDVPLAISALSAKALEDRAINDTVELSQFTPGFDKKDQVAGPSGHNNRLFSSLVFRGLNLANNSGLRAGGLLFLDGAPVISGQVPGLTDIEQVEVLRGPQSAYFGRSTFAGAINFITRDPSDEFKGRIKAGYGKYGSNEAAISIEGALIKDVLKVRLSGDHRVEGGQYTNQADLNEELGRKETNSISATAVLTPNDRFRAKAYVNYYEDRDGPAAHAALKPSESNCTLGAGLPYYCGVVPRIPGAFISANNQITPYAYNQLFNNVTNIDTLFNPKFRDKAGLSRDAIMSNLSMDYDFDNGYSLGSITAFHKSKTQAVVDIGFRDARNAVPMKWWLNVSQMKEEDFSQEIRLNSPSDDRFRYVVGANYIKGRVDGNFNYGLSSFGTSVFADPGSLKASTPGLFGGVYYDVVERLTVSGEARYQWDKLEQVSGTGSEFSKTFKSFSPRITVDYKIADEATVYGLWSRGYRPGGFNTQLDGQPQAVLDQLTAALGSDLAYDQERIDNYELGIKGRFLDGRAQVALSVYKGAVYDQQTQSSTLTNLPGGGVRLFSVTTNLGRTNFKGVELEGSFLVTPELMLEGSFAYNDTSIVRFDCRECQTYITGSTDVKGNQLPGVPRTTLSASATYTDTLTTTYDWFVRADYIYRSTNYANYENIAETGNSHRVNLRGGVQSDDIRIELYVENLTKDDTYLGLSRGVDVLTLVNNELRVALPEKRSFGIKATYNF